MGVSESESGAAPDTGATVLPLTLPPHFALGFLPLEAVSVFEGFDARGVFVLCAAALGVAWFALLVCCKARTLLLVRLRLGALRDVGNPSNATNSILPSKDKQRGCWGVRGSPEASLT